MAFIQLDSREGCFRPQSVTHFTVHVTVENFDSSKRRYITFIRLHSGNSQIAQHHWTGDQALSYGLIGKILLRAEESSDAVLTFNSLIEDEIKLSDDSL
jgi:hypothetical protein